MGQPRRGIDRVGASDIAIPFPRDSYSEWSVSTAMETSEYFGVDEVVLMNIEQSTI